MFFSLCYRATIFRVMSSMGRSFVMGKLARIGIGLGIAVTLAMGATGVASAAPSAFVAKAVHSGGAGATAATATGTLAWSSSLKTVTLANVKLFVKGGECAHVLIAGYQGSTVVTDPFRFPSSGCLRPAADHTYPIGTVSQTAGVAGGIQDLEVFAIDDDHDVTGFADCYQAESTCRTGLF
ncbi:hypothetical protein [Amycolatopsis sp. NPDC051903]|uniref:hypothetical protein n=1 Tax=Amycolatopsis sp. NPDC051903 TaxID=3363936 RepID=UPI0037AED0D6